MATILRTFDTHSFVATDRGRVELIPNDRLIALEPGPSPILKSRRRFRIYDPIPPNWRGLRRWFDMRLRRVKDVTTGLEITCGRHDGRWYVFAEHGR